MEDSALKILTREASKTAPQERIQGTFIVGFSKCGQHSLRDYLNVPLIEQYIINSKLVDYKHCQLIVITRNAVGYRRACRKYAQENPDFTDFDAIIKERRRQGYNIKQYRLEEVSKAALFPHVRRDSPPKQG